MQERCGERGGVEVATSCLGKRRAFNQEKIPLLPHAPGSHGVKEFFDKQPGEREHLTCLGRVWPHRGPGHPERCVHTLEEAQNTPLFPQGQAKAALRRVLSAGLGVPAVDAVLNPP